MTPGGAAVRLPPPLIFLGGWLAAWGLQQRIEFAIDGAGPNAVQIGIGAALMVTGVFLMGWAIRTLILARTTILPHGAVRQVVTAGPFGFTRNPIYVGMTAMYLGAAALANMAWPLVLLPIVLMVVTATVIEREEHYLSATFGDAYGEYSRRVRRWL